MIPAKRKRFLWTCAALAAFAAWQAWTLRAYIAADTRPPAWDEANHLEVAWKYFHAASAGRWSDIWRYTPNAAIPPFPPLYHLGLSFSYLFSNPAGTALWVNWFYLVLLSASIYSLTRKYWRADTAAGAVVIFICAPTVQELFRTQLIDLPLTAVVAAAYWALLHSDEFQRWSGSLWFGLAFAAGMLHKWSFFSYLFPAYWLIFAALRSRDRRPKALAAVGIGLGLSLPWYLIRTPLVLIRLTQASSDFVVPFWKGAAFFHYLSGMPSALGLPFCVLAGFSVWELRSDRRPLIRLLLLWILSSYVFWALLPNRQMRYLLPGLTGLAVLIAAACPRPLILGLAAWQAFASLIWPGAIPAAEDWKISKVLETVASERKPGLTAVAIIADTSYFNKLNFLWQADVSGIKNIEFRGVKDVPWELSEFVVFKKGDLAHSTVIENFHDAETAILRQNGWFSRAFEEHAHWPLPDGSAAVLYRRKRPVAAPFRERHLRLPLYFSSLAAVPEAELTFGAWNSGKGAYDHVSVRAREARLKGVLISNLHFELTGAVLVPDADDGKRGARLVQIRRVEILSAVLTQKAIAELMKRAPLRIDALTLDGTARLEARIKGIPISVEVAPKSDAPGQACTAELLSVRLAGLPLPPHALLRYGANGPLLNLETAGDQTTLRTIFGLSRTLPFPVKLSGCSARDGRLSIP